MCTWFYTKQKTLQAKMALKKTLEAMYVEPTVFQGFFLNLVHVYMHLHREKTLEAQKG